VSARLRGQIAIHNDTDQVLTRTRLELAHGQWTDPWYPPESIAPGARAEFRSEGPLIAGVPSKGTEGRIAFRIGADPGDELYVHWNVPHVPSVYGNTFHVWGPTGFEAAATGGHQRPRSQLEVRLRPSALRSVPGFSPSSNGFTFSNTRWSERLPVLTFGELWQRLWDALPVELKGVLVPASVVLPFAGSAKLTHGGHGLCGGMVFATMDYWHAHQRPPDRPIPTRADDPLFVYVRDRLLDSFDFDGRGHRWLAYSSPHYPDGDQGISQNVLGSTKGRAWITYRDEWPLIRADISEGRPSPIGLVQTTALDIGRNHQVLAYAYTQSGQHVTLHIYDPNLPGNDVQLTFDITRTDGRVHVGRTHGDATIRAIFRMDGYAPRSPIEGRPGRRRSDTCRDLMEASSGQRSGSLASALAGHRRPISIRSLL
jgi:hypothetical protein